jgi:hypothetical protein
MTEKDHWRPEGLESLVRKGKMSVCKRKKKREKRKKQDKKKVF